MQYSKLMIEYIFEIRKVAPAPLKSRIKLADPNLLDLLADAYSKLQDRRIKERIEQLMSLAGPAWLSLLHSPGSAPKNYQTKTYRGQANNQPAQITPRSKTGSKHIIYRGQVVHN